MKEKLCWVCGQKLGRWLAFTIGPMCCVNRTTGEPPAHLECAEWSVKGCPFLTRPSMERRENNMPESYDPENVAGFAIRRNPGATAIWVTDSYTVFPDGQGRYLIEIGPLASLQWWREGRGATRAEVRESIDTGLPLLHAACEREATPALRALAHAEVAARYEAALGLLPRV